ncbi:DUF4230 domain-containing protein [Blastomonas sp. UPD001]|uniref:DUF4230 domain-containing protein n=1 Tax=Blastomonas sp. UPD001 TaxID=2217673 RepID=UPI000E344794|nr:DUF4230 domain-containing protein [Blastomonas sp. UPD001]
MSGKNALLLLPIATFGLGYWVAPKEQLDREVEQSGFLQVDTKQVLATTVESLREENKLVVYSYKGTARVKVKRTKLWLFGGTQLLIVPAVVNYHIDLRDLTLADVQYDEKTKIVRVKVPRVKLGDIAFQPEQATTINGGVLTYSQQQVDELQKLNYASARRAITAQAQGRGLVTAARRRAIDNVQSYFEIPLRIVGQPDVKVVATF